MTRRRYLVLGWLGMAVALSASPQPGRNRAGLNVFQDALAKEGFDTVVIPSSMLNLGLGAGADTLVIAQRIAQWQDPAAGASYLAHPPLTGFRVTPRASAAADPFPAPRLRVRGTGRTEMDLMNKLGELRAGIIDANPALSATEYLARPVAYDGYDYIQRAADPFGDTRDTLYLAAGYFPPLGWTDVMTLADDEFLVVYGPNHVATGKVTYMNINAYSSVKGQLVLGSVYDDELPGTAASYLPPGDPAADLMYVYKLAKDCHGESNCLSLSTGGCPRVPALGDTDPLMVVIRGYLEPSTRVGPAYTEVLYDRVIKFSPR